MVGVVLLVDFSEALAEETTLLISEFLAIIPLHIFFSGAAAHYSIVKIN